MLSRIIAGVDLGKVSQSARSTSGMSINPEFILWGVLAVAGLCAGLFCWHRFRARMLPDGASPESLFEELCRVHRLNRSERRLLTQAVSVAGLAEPAAAFVNPDSLLDMTHSSSSASDYRALTEKLFGSEATGRT